MVEYCGASSRRDKSLLQKTTGCRRRKINWLIIVVMIAAVITHTVITTQIAIEIRFVLSQYFDWKSFDVRILEHLTRLLNARRRRNNVEWPNFNGQLSLGTLKFLNWKLIEGFKECHQFESLFRFSIRSHNWNFKLKNLMF